MIPQIALAIPGVTTYGASHGMPAGLAATMATKKAELLLLNTNYEQARLDLRNSTKAKNLALKNARTHLRTVRELLRPVLTPTYSQLWDAVGFVGSLTLPEQEDPALAALGKLGSYLTENAALGADEPNLVAAKTIALETALANGIAAVNTDKADRERLAKDRADKAEEVRQILREILSVLRVKLPPLDSQWHEFGFNKPGARPIPDAPTEVTATLFGTNAALMKFPAVSRADHYRFWIKVVGVDTDFGAVGTSTDLSFVFEQLPANAQVELAVSAVNEGGESARSASVTVLTQ